MNDYKELIDELKFLSKHVTEQMCDENGKDALMKAVETIEELFVGIESLSKELFELKIILDMYGGEEGITEAFKKAEQLNGALEDLHGLCWCCKNGKRWDKASPWSKATTCEYMRELGALARSGGKCKCSHWEWRGVKDN